MTSLINEKHGFKEKEHIIEEETASALGDDDANDAVHLMFK